MCCTVDVEQVYSLCCLMAVGAALSSLLPASQHLPRDFLWKRWFIALESALLATNGPGQVARYQGASS